MRIQKVVLEGEAVNSYKPRWNRTQVALALMMIAFVAMAYAVGVLTAYAPAVKMANEKIAECENAYNPYHIAMPQVFKGSNLTFNMTGVNYG